MTDEDKNYDLKESLGFERGADIEVYLVDSRNKDARQLGFLRPDYKEHEPRLYERFDLRLDSPGTQSVYFGQRNLPPTVTPLNPEAEGLFSGQLETERFKAVARLEIYSPYYPDRYILTLDVRKIVLDTSQGLPDAWLPGSSEDKAP